MKVISFKSIYTIINKFYPSWNVSEFKNMMNYCLHFHSCFGYNDERINLESIGKYFEILKPEISSS